MRITRDFNQHRSVVLSVAGELDMASSAALNTEVADVLTGYRTRHLIIDLADVRFLDMRVHRLWIEHAYGA